MRRLRDVHSLAIQVPPCLAAHIPGVVHAARKGLVLQRGRINKYMTPGMSNMKRPTWHMQAIMPYQQRGIDHPQPVALRRHTEQG